MQQILAPFMNNNIMVYIDDILIISETFETHINMVNKILTTLANDGIKINVTKFNFLQKRKNNFPWSCYRSRRQSLIK